jgi:class 3 adenylate cyclase
LFGTCLNTAVRVCAVASAESVLVSELACQLVAGRPFRFNDGAVVALKGLREPLRVRELIWRAA